MRQLFPREILLLGTDQLEVDDLTYSVSPPWWPLGSLLESIRSKGVLSPLHVEPVASGRFRVVMGFRRCRAALELALESLPCLVRTETAPVRLFTEALSENLATRPLHDVERAWVLLKLTRDFRIRFRRLVDEFLPMLGLPPSGYHLDRYRRLGQLPENLQRALLAALDLEVALQIGAWQTDEQDLFLHLATTYHLGRNKQKEVCSLLDDLRIQRGSSAARLWSSLVPREARTEASGSRATEFEHVLGKLRRLRFPTLAGYEDRCRVLRSKLRIPPEIHLQVPAGFEGNRLSVTFAFRNPAELKDLSRDLERIADQPELAGIFELL